MRIYIVAVMVLLGGCSSARKLFPQYEKDHGPQSSAPPADYTTAGTTTENFQLVPVRVADSTLIIRVQRPGEDWYLCDRFEVRLSTQGVGGGSVRFWYRNLSVNGFAPPVAPAGTKFEIESILD